MMTAALLALCVAFGTLTSDDESNTPSSPPSIGGTLSGRVTYSGPLPPPIMNPEAATRRLPVAVDPKSKGLREAAVWVEGASIDDRSFPPVADDAEPIIVDQVNFEFVPHVITVEAGRPVEFLNNDVANHGVTASGSTVANRFNVTTPPGGQYVHRFQSSRQPVPIGCPVHVAMSAWVFVFDHPFHTVTDDQGQFRLANLPPGRHTLVVHHPDGGLRRRIEVEVHSGETTKLDIPFEAEDLRPPARRP